MGSTASSLWNPTQGPTTRTLSSVGVLGTRATLATKGAMGTQATLATEGAMGTQETLATEVAMGILASEVALGTQAAGEVRLGQNWRQ